jgi:hypothetical protein
VVANYEETFEANKIDRYNQSKIYDLLWMGKMYWFNAYATPNDMGCNIALKKVLGKL